MGGFRRGLPLLAACLVFSGFAPGVAGAAAPTAAMMDVLYANATSAWAVGTAEDGGEPTTYRFAHGPASSTWCTTNGLVGSPAGTTAETAYDPDEPWAFGQLLGLTVGTEYCVAMLVTNASGSARSQPVRYTHGGPHADLDDIVSSSATSSTVSGGVFAAGSPGTYRVRYDLQSSAWCTADAASGTPAHSTAPQDVPAPLDEYHDVSIPLTGLTAGAAYCAVLEITTGVGTDTAGPLEFVQGQPAATTWFVEPKSATAALLLGSVNPAGQPTTYRAEYDLASSSWCTGGGTGTPAHQTPPQTLPETDSEHHDVEVLLTGLTGGTEYCARITATNGGGTARGGLETFTPGLPEVWLSDAVPASATATDLRGYIRTFAQPTTYRAVYDVASSAWCRSWGESGAPAHATPAQQLPGTEHGYADVTTRITGLTAGTAYCGTIEATNASGTMTSWVIDFVQSAPGAGAARAHSTGATTTVVRGAVNPGGLSTTYRIGYDVRSSDFCRDQGWGDDSAPAHLSAPQTLPSTAAGRHEVAVTLTGLAAGTHYCAAVVAANAAGSDTGFPDEFLQGAPEAQTDAVRPTGPSTAHVEGAVNPIAQATTYRVDYDLADSAYCESMTTDGVTAAHSTDPQPLGHADDAWHTVDVALTGLAPGEWYCASVVGLNASGASPGSRYWFLQGVPAVAIDDVRSTGATTARVEGTINPAAQATTYRLLYDAEDSDWCNSAGDVGTPAFATGEQTLTSTDAVDHDVAFDLAGLTSGASYCALIVAVNDSGTSEDWPWWFEQGAPSAAVTDARATGGSTATITGLVGPAGQATTYRAVWDRADSEWCASEGWDGAPTHAGPSQALGSTDGDRHEVTVALTGLTRQTGYCVALEATNGLGTRISDQAFFTSTVDAPAITSLFDAGSGTTATVGGTIVPHGAATTYRFEYGKTDAYGSSTPTGNAGAGDGPTTAEATLSGLEPDTTYHWRLVAENAGGSTASGDQTFTTGPADSGPPPGDPPTQDPPDEKPPVQDPPAQEPPPAAPSQAPAPGDPPVTTSSTTPQPPADRTGPRVGASLRSAVRRGLLLKRGTPLEATCDEACEITVTLVLPARLAKRLGLPRVAGTAKGRLTAAGAVRLAPVLTAKAKRRLANAGPFRLGIVVAAVDAAGNGGTATKSVAVAP